jgi:hypothetical protein
VYITGSSALRASGLDRTSTSVEPMRWESSCAVMAMASCREGRG